MINCIVWRDENLFDQVFAEEVRLPRAVNSETLLCCFLSWACTDLRPGTIHCPSGQSYLVYKPGVLLLFVVCSGGAVAVVLGVFRIKMTLKPLQNMRLVGHIFFLCLIIWFWVLNQPKCILVLLRRIIIHGCCQALSFIFQDGLWDQWKIWQILLLKCTTEHLRSAFYFVTVTTRWSLKEQFHDKLSSTQGINSFWKGHPGGNWPLREPPDFSSMSVCIDSFACVDFFFLCECVVFVLFWFLITGTVTFHMQLPTLCFMHSSLSIVPSGVQRREVRGCSAVKHSTLRRSSRAGRPLHWSFLEVILIALVPPSLLRCHLFGHFC